LIPVIVEHIHDKIKSKIESIVDQELTKYGTRVTLPYLAGVTFDYAQMSGPNMKDNLIQVEMDGSSYNVLKPDVFGATANSFPLRNESGKSL
jgi:hypothetical protein